MIRRLSLSEYQVLRVLDEPIKEPIAALNIELFEGDNYIYLEDMVGNKFYAEYLIKNDFNEIYATRNEMNSAINQTAQQIELTVDRKLEGYSTTEEVKGMLKVEARQYQGRSEWNLCNKNRLRFNRKDIKGIVRT